MADNIAITPGVGASVRTDDVGGIQYQVVKFDLGGDGVSQLPSVNSGTKDNGTLRVVLATDQPSLTNAISVSDAGGSLSVDDGGGSITIDGNVGVTGTVTVDSELTTADLDTGAGTDTRAVVGLVIAKSGGAANISNTDPLPISDAGGNISIDDGGNSITVDGAVTVSGTVTANAGTGTMAVDSELTTADLDTGAGTDTKAVVGLVVAASGGAVNLTGNSGTKDNGTIRVVLATDQPQLTNKLLVTPDANSSINLNQIAGTTPDVNSGNKGAGTLRVVLATDQPALTSPLKTTQTPAASGGLSTAHLVSAATTNATNVKASAGQLFGWYIYNSNAAARKVAFHNTAGTPSAGTSVLFSVVIPPGSAANVEFTNGIVFSTGIAFTTVTGLADSDNVAVAANDLIINLFYA